MSQFQPAPGAHATAGAPVPALPVELTSFIGRDRELAELDRMLPSLRLLTLTGAGGSGKTRLALELLLRRAQPDVAWVELAGLTEPGLVARRVADAFGLREEVLAGSPERLAGLLVGRSALLVLDNCEHVIDTCAELVDALLQRCPGISVLATSREPLGVRGERAWLVPPLSLPDEAADAQGLEAAEAIRLFVERAREVAPSFALDSVNAPIVVDICRRLDGIPLAVELAAARVKHLAVADIRDRLDDAFRLLSSGERRGLPRHRTLRATMDWSYDLLGGDERRLLTRLSVFRGGFTLDAAEEVAAGDGLHAADILDLLARLVDRSLVVVREEAGGGRYALLETVRQYAAQRLDESGDAPLTERRHADWVAALVAQAEPHFITPQRRAWFDRLLPEFDNIRAALAWTATHDGPAHVRLVGMLGWFWFSTSRWTEAHRWYDGALALPAAQGRHRDRAALLFAAGALAALQARHEPARERLFEAADIAREVGDERLVAYARNYLAMTWAQAGDPQALPHSEAAEAWFREHRDDYGLRLSLLLQGITHEVRSDVARGRALMVEAVDIARRFGQDRELAIALQMLGMNIAREDPHRGADVTRESLVALRRDPSFLFITRGFEVVAGVLAMDGRHEDALRLLGAASMIRASIGAVQFQADAQRVAATMTALQAAVEPTTFQRVMDEGRRLTLEQAFDLAIGSARSPRDADAVATTVPLVVRALGSLDIHLDGVPLNAGAWKYARPREVLLFLLLHPHGRSRDEIGVAFWPDASAAQVKNNLHVAVHRLRKTLGDPSWIQLDGDRYRVPLDRVDFDVHRFESLATEALRSPDATPARLEEALSLYRGDLFEGEVVGDWHLQFRDRLARLHEALALRLGDAYGAAAKWRDAALAYERVVLTGALSEEAYRRAMAAWSRAGERAQASRLYQRLASLLRSELDDEPDPETRALYERIRAD